VPEFIEAGIDDVLTKPARIDQIITMMLRHSDRSGALADAAAMPATEAEDPFADDDPQLDEDHFVALVEDMGPEFMAKMTEAFRVETHEALAAIREAASRGDLPEVRTIAHKSAGGAAAIGLSRLAELLRKQEADALSGKNPIASGELDQIDSLFQRNMRHLDVLMAGA